MKPIKIAAVSDTHGYDFRITKEADIWIFAGDYTSCSKYDMITQTFQFLGFMSNIYKNLEELREQKKRLPLKIYISFGNHDHFAEFNMKHPEFIEMGKKIFNRFNTHVEFVGNNIVKFKGKRIVAIPYSRNKNGAFKWTEQTENKVKNILKNSKPDILITHAPPLGILDEKNGENLGEERFENYLNGHKPKLWIFGHIHEGYGTEKIGDTLYCNVAYKQTDLIEFNPITYIELEREN